VRPDEEETAFRKVAAEADFALVIAPEFDNLLLERSEWAQAEGCRLLGPEPATIRLTGDKRALAAHLQARGVPTPPVFSCCVAVLPELTWPAVCKPRHGAGSTATFLVQGPSELAGCIAQSQAEGCGDELLLQPFLPGLPASVAFLIGPRQSVALLPAEQHLSEDGRFHYLGGRIPLPDELSQRAVR